MGHPLRHYEPNVVYEVTMRTIQGRMLLRPSRRLNEMVAGMIGRAQEMYPAIRLHGVFVLSNHLTWLVSSPSPWCIPNFLGYVHGGISRELTRLHDWPGTVWERRHRPIPIVDEASQVERMRYLLSQGTKEGLVESPHRWPGVSCVSALTGGGPLLGTWHDRGSAYKARRRGERVSGNQFATRYTVRFAPLPCWAALSRGSHCERIRQLIREIEKNARKNRQAGNRSVLGRKAVTRTHPHQRPRGVARSPAPVCHAATLARWRAYKRRYRSFVSAFREAAAQLRQGARDVVFPAHSFPPPTPFVRVA